MSTIGYEYEATRHAYIHVRKSGSTQKRSYEVTIRVDGKAYTKSAPHEKAALALRNTLINDLRKRYGEHVAPMFEFTI